MIDELISEINELKNYKKKYESTLKDKQAMSDLLYDLMSEKYNNLSYEERIEWHKKEMCNHCRYYPCVSKLSDKLPDDVGCVIPSEKAWIPSRVCCKHFNWN